MTEYKTGDRVQVSNLILDEPCSEVEELRNKVGTVVDPDVDDEDYDGNPCKKVLVKLDEEVSGGGWPESYSDTFVFKPEELSKRLFKWTHIDVDSGQEVTSECETWAAADALVRLYQRNAIPAWHVED